MLSKNRRNWLLHPCSLGIAALSLVLGYFIWSEIAPKRNAARSFQGVYSVAVTTDVQIPTVFRGNLVTISDVGNGKLRATNERGNALDLTYRKNGLYFSEAFVPVGASLSSAITKHWNDGRISESGDGLLITGRMHEKGLGQFFLPWEDVIEWSVQLKRISDSPPAPQNRDNRLFGPR